MRVRIGLSDAAREIELEIDEVDAFVESAEEAMKAGVVLWVTDTDEHKVGIPAKRIAYIDISPETHRSAGF